MITQYEVMKARVKQQEEQIAALESKLSNKNLSEINDTLKEIVDALEVMNAKGQWYRKGIL